MNKNIALPKYYLINIIFLVAKNSPDSIKQKYIPAEAGLP